MGTSWEAGRMSASTEVDVVVIGQGPGGEYVATNLAKGGLDVVAV
jgi:flavin-dependent dehydrogenase